MSWQWDAPILFDCSACGRETPRSQLARIDGHCDCVCDFCDLVDECFAELLEPDPLEEVRMIVMRAAGGGYWVARTDYPGKRRAPTLTKTCDYINAMHPHAWPCAEWPRDKGMWMNYEDRQALGLCQKREWL